MDIQQTSDRTMTIAKVVVLELQLTSVFECVVWRFAETHEIVRLTRDSNVDWSLFPDLQSLGECLDDEDHWDQDCETLFGESGDVAYQSTQVERNNQEQDDHGPHSDPETERHEVEGILPGQSIEYKEQEKVGSKVLFCSRG